jgi:hypothetical protein
MATRKKYKIVLSEKYVRKSDNGKEWFQFPVDVSGQLVAIQTIIPLDPYIEPDLEQVKKEAYEEGFKDGQYAERNGLVANYAQVHKIKIGDEVTAEHGGSTFTVTWMSDVCICGIDSDGRCYSYKINEVDGKTGNHHDITTFLEKMRGEQDG